jgi:drug/metabolite transporter (DMT)-like permease
VFAALLAGCFLKERIGPFEITSLLLTLGGIVFVIQPPFLFADSSGYYNVGHVMPAVLCLVGAFFSAVNMVVTRSLKDLDLFVISAWIGLFGIFPPIIFMFAVGNPSLPCLADVPFIIMTATISWLGHCCLILALNVRRNIRVMAANLDFKIIFSLSLPVRFPCCARR